jgi:hypothetical protein
VIRILTSLLDILLDSAYDETFYDQVIHACGLRQDIETLPRRDLTKLGDKGVETNPTAVVLLIYDRIHAFGGTETKTGRLWPASHCTVLILDVGNCSRGICSGRSRLAG